jgi:hypothetical protein
MPKLAGYDFTLTAFLPADANDPEAMMKALHVIRGTIVTLSEAGFKEIEARPKYRSRREVADEAPTDAAVDRVAGEADHREGEMAAGIIHEPGTNGPAPSDDVLDIPEHLRRKRTA